MKEDRLVMANPPASPYCRRVQGSKGGEKKRCLKRKTFDREPKETSESRKLSDEGRF